MNAGHAPWPHMALFSISIKGDHDALWGTAQICSAPSRTGETSPGLGPDYGLCLLTCGVKVS